MALQQFVFGFVVAIICTSKGGHTSLVCGKVQGPDDSPKNWPWQVSITRDGSYVCGGTLINDQWVLVAAQYLQAAPDTNLSSLVVYLGSTVSSSFSGSNVTRGVDSKFCYLSFKYYHPSNICLLKLSAPVSFSPNIPVQPVCLAAQGSTFHTQDSGWVAGWTTEYYGHYKQHTYNEMNVSVVGQNECSCVKYTTMFNNLLCTVLSTSSTSLQNVGVPLVVKQDSVWVQAGIQSDNCQGSDPCVYTKVSEYQDWIMEVTGSNNQTGFVNVTSSGRDRDMDFKCTHPIYDIFGGGDKMIPHFSQLLSLCAVTLLLFVMG